MVKFESVCEVALVIESTIKRDLRQRFIGFKQLCCSAIQPKPPNIFTDRAAIASAECPRQMRRMNPNRIGDA